MCLFANNFPLYSLFMSAYIYIAMVCLNSTFTQKRTVNLLKVGEGLSSLISSSRAAVNRILKTKWSFLFR